MNDSANASALRADCDPSGGTVKETSVVNVLLACCACLSRDAVTRDLERLGHRVFLASSVAETLDLTLSARPSVVALELRLGHVVTLDLIETLRKAAPLHARVVVTTKYQSVATAFRAFQLGADAYLVYPLESADLLAVGRNITRVNQAPQVNGVMSLHRAVWEYINRKRVAAGTMTGAAERLGLDRRSLRRMLAKYPPMQ